MMEKFSRSESLLGEKAFASFSSSKVAVFGLGGVGGTAAEGLLRGGLGKLCLIDFDKVSESNLNRQILYSEDSVGLSKTEQAKKRLLGINPSCQISLIEDKANAVFFSRHDLSDCDFIIDAIDDVDGKLAIAQYAISKGIRFISCLGMANRMDPSKVYLTSLDKTSGDPLAKKIRNVYRKAGVDLSKVEVVASSEEPLVKGKTPSSMMMVPSEAGLLIDSVVILYLANKAK